MFFVTNLFRLFIIVVHFSVSSRYSYDFYSYDLYSYGQTFYVSIFLLKIYVRILIRQKLGLS
jgi:hypothetical protein